MPCGARSSTRRNSRQRYEPALGARPLRRAILRKLQDPLAERILSGSLAEGATLRVTMRDDELTFE
ncbi:MAG TPA: hypothetical protein VI072_01410 [Polyangiaceae bacterium]